MDAGTASARPRGIATVLRLAVFGLVGVLTTVILVFLVLRVAEDVGNARAGVLPPVEDFARRYAEHPVIAYTHILAGAVYLLGALLQTSVRARTRLGLRRHRRLGRVVLASGLVSGVYAVVVGVVMPFGGPVEAAASTVFGAYFVVALGLAYRAIRERRVQDHRRWMVRALAVGLGVGSIRIWVGLFEATGITTFEAGFGLAFWLGLSSHALAAEAWLRWWPRQPVLARGLNRR